MWTIYALADPRTFQIRYIGQTQNHPSVRLQEHIKKEDGNKRKWAWLEELAALGTSPNVIILDYAKTLEEALSKERYWIEKGRAIEWPLLNFRVEGKRLFRVVRNLKPRQRSTDEPGRWDDVVAAWFAAHPAALTGAALGISDLARAMCADAEGSIDNYEAYKGRAHKLFHEFRNAVRLPGGERIGVDVSNQGA